MKIPCAQPIEQGPCCGADAEYAACPRSHMAAGILERPRYRWFYLSLSAVSVTLTLCRPYTKIGDLFTDNQAYLLVCQEHNRESKRTPTTAALNFHEVQKAPSRRVTSSTSKGTTARQRFQICALLHGRSGQTARGASAKRRYRRKRHRARIGHSMACLPMAEVCSHRIPRDGSIYLPLVASRLNMI